MLAIKYDKRTIGQDCDTVLCWPISSLQVLSPLLHDYVATGKNRPAKLEQVVAGVAEGCVQAGAAILVVKLLKCPRGQQYG